MSPGSSEIATLSEFSRRVRMRVLRMSHEARTSHIGSCFSATDLLVALYGYIMRYDPANPKAKERDRFILSKGHACAAVYSILAEKGFFPEEWLDHYGDEGSSLPKHITHTVPGVEASTGSLGHGLPIACGMALAGKRSHASYRVFALLSDGECEEGSTWEAAMFAAHRRLDSLVVIVDYNQLQAFGRTEDVAGLSPLAAKWSAFGWDVREVDGHDFGSILGALEHIPFRADKPSCVIAHTIKGKGVSFMEDRLEWHYRYPDESDFARALAELQSR